MFIIRSHRSAGHDPEPCKNGRVNQWMCHLSFLLMVGQETTVYLMGALIPEKDQFWERICDEDPTVTVETWW